MSNLRQFESDSERITLSQHSSIAFPPTNSTEQLIGIALHHREHQTRLSALAKIKVQILSTQSNSFRPEPQMSKTVEAVFIQAVKQVIIGAGVYQTKRLVEQRMFFNVVGQAVKYYFRDEGFQQLLAKVTGLLEGKSQRVEPALSLFLQILTAIDSQSVKGFQSRCLFQRALVNDHINSLLVLGNYCIERGVLPERVTIEDGAIDSFFSIQAPEQTLLAAIKLIRACLCFDWPGDQRTQQFEDQVQMMVLLLPVRRSKTSADWQIDKWIKSNEWVRLYHFIFRDARLLELRIEVLDLIGDFARVHLKLFKQKTIFKAHIQSVVYALGNCLHDLEVNKSSYQTVELAIALGYNLNKLLTSTARSILFDINPNFIRTLIENLCKFLIHQIIREQIFNVNLIYFYFNFTRGLTAKCRLEKDKIGLEEFDFKMKELCREYEHYFRILLNRIRRSPIRFSEDSRHRLEFRKLKDCLDSYDWDQLKVYFFPFTVVSPRYHSINSIYELFTYVSARVTRAVSILEMFRLERWEAESARNIISWEIKRIADSFQKTSFKKRARQFEEEDSPLPFIDEVQNEEEDYCHMLRLSVFMILNEIYEKNPLFFLKVNCQMMKLIVVTLQLCLDADLQEEGSEEAKNESCLIKIEEGLAMCVQIFKKIQLREQERILLNISRFKYQPCPERYRYEFYQADLDYHDFDLESENNTLSSTLVNIYPRADPRFKPFLVEMGVNMGILHSNYARSLQFIDSFEACFKTVEIISESYILRHLLRRGYAEVETVLQQVLNFVIQADSTEDDILIILKILKKLALLTIGSFKEEAENKLFLLLKLNPEDIFHRAEIEEQFRFQLINIAHEFRNNNGWGQLCQQIQNRTIFSSKKEPERMDLQTTYLSFDYEQSQKFFEGTSDQNSWIQNTKEEVTLGKDAEIHTEDEFQIEKIDTVLNKYISSEEEVETEVKEDVKVEAKGEQEAEEETSIYIPEAIEEKSDPSELKTPVKLSQVKSSKKSLGRTESKNLSSSGSRELLLMSSSSSEELKKQSTSQ